MIAETGHELVVIDKLTYAANLASLDSVAGDPRFQLLRLDICEAGAMADAIAAVRPDAIIHLAAETHVDRSIDGPDAFIRTNILGAHVVLETARRYWSTLSAEARGSFRILHVSTDEVFGSLGPTGAFTERTAYDPSSPYSASKAASDHIARASFRTYGLPVLTCNSSNNYGPCQFPEKLIPLTILNALGLQPISVFGDGRNVRDWLHVEDHARALLAVLKLGAVGETYNIGARAERTNLEIVETICDTLDELRPADGGRRRLIRFVADRPGHDRRYAIDPTKIEQATGWRPRQTFEAGLRATIEWYLANPSWWQPIRENVYRGERLGL